MIKLIKIYSSGLIRLYKEQQNRQFDLLVFIGFILYKEVINELLLSSFQYKFLYKKQWHLTFVDQVLKGVQLYNPFILANVMMLLMECVSVSL